MAETDSGNTQKRKRVGPPHKWKPGQSGNPSGRPKLPEEIRLMKTEILQRAIEIMHEKIMDEKFMNSLKPSELDKFLETGYDRFGLPKVTVQELNGKDGTPLTIKLVKYGTDNPT